MSESASYPSQIALTSVSRSVEPFIAFLKPRVSIGEPVDFQISLSLPSGSGAVDIDYSRLELHIVGLSEPLRLIRRDASTMAEAGPAPFELGDLNTPAERPAPLSWTPGQCRIFSGRLVVKDETTVTVCRAGGFAIGEAVLTSQCPQLEKAILHAEVGGWPVMFRLPQPGPAAGAPRWINPEGPDVQLLQDDPTRCPCVPFHSPSSPLAIADLGLLRTASSAAMLGFGSRPNARRLLSWTSASPFRSRSPMRTTSRWR